MAIYRRSKRKTGGKRKAAVRRPRRKNLASKIYTFKRSIYQPAWINTLTVGDTPFKMNPQLTDIPNSTELTALFDQYRISGVSVKLVPRFSVTESSTAINNPAVYPPSQVMSCLDYDGNGPTTIAALCQYQNVKVSRGMSVHQRFFKPAILSMIYESGLTTAYGPKWGQFIDTSNPTVPHFGLAGMIPECYQAYSYDLYATYYIQCKNVR